MKTKAEIRKQVAQLKAALNPAELASKSKQITRRLLDELDWEKVKTVHVYRSLPKLREPDTAQLIKSLHKAKIYSPASRDPAEHLEISSEDAQPAGLPDEIDLIVVPLVAFDQQGYRIGHGGGYYDRFLKLYPNAQKIGLAFELQKVKGIPVEPHDVPLDVVITEAHKYVFAK